MSDIAAQGFAAEVANEPFLGLFPHQSPHALAGRRQSLDDVTADEPRRARYQRFHSDPSRFIIEIRIGRSPRRMVREVIGTSGRIEWKWSPNQPAGWPT
jgi:hypothetical protein